MSIIVEKKAAVTDICYGIKRIVVGLFFLLLSHSLNASEQQRELYLIAEATSADRIQKDIQPVSYTHLTLPTTPYV